MLRSDQAITRTRPGKPALGKAPFGSVQFFRQLILVMLFAVLPLSLVAVLTLSILFVQMKTDLQAQIDQLHSELTAVTTLHPGMVADSDLNSALALTTDTSLVQPDFQSGDQQNSTERVNLDAADQANPVTEPVPEPEQAPAKTAYLTFDDGPSPRTLEILDILDTYQVKATFFVTNPALEDYPAIARDLVDRGHTIGLHSSSHKYSEIYQSIDHFLLDLAENSRLIESITGVVPAVLRFPGGSVNAYNETIAADLIDAVTANGYAYFDWNCASGDAVGQTIPPNSIVENVRQSRQGKNSLVILFHDSTGKKTTVQALPDVIQDLQADGYVFSALTQDSVPVRFAKIP